MEDTQSQDSTSTADEFLFVAASPPQMRIPGGSDPARVQSELNDILREPNSCKASAAQRPQVNDLPSSAFTDAVDSNTVRDSKQVRTSMFVQNVVYLGSALLTQPKDCSQLHGAIEELRDCPNSTLPSPITISVPTSCFGDFRVFDSDKVLLASFSVSNMPMIIRNSSSARGLDTLFAFSYCELQSSKSCASPTVPAPTSTPPRPGSPNSSTSASPRPAAIITSPVVGAGLDFAFRCHVFQCRTAVECESVVRQLRQACFSQCPSSPTRTWVNTFVKLRIEIDIQEDDGNGQFYAVPREKPDLFKLRAHVDKRVVFTVTQVAGTLSLTLQRIVGLFLGAGRNLQPNAFVLLETECDEKYEDRRTLTVTGHWNAGESDFQPLDTPTEKDHYVFFTVGVHLHAPPVNTPITLKLHLKARIFPETERFWLYNKKPIVEECRVWLKEANNAPRGEVGERRLVLYEAVGMDFLSQSTSPGISALPASTSFDSFMLDKVASLGHRESVEGSVRRSESGLSPTGEDEDDEPLLSGSGHVSKEVTDAQLMKQWESALVAWHTNLDEMPPSVRSLVQRGVPDALRGVVWMRLAQVHQKEKDLLEVFKILITKDGPQDAAILRDMHRTFPGNELFSEAELQQQLFRVSKAYSLYDEEIGYVQGISFLVAALLLHMPEEQAWMVLVRIMYGYRLRDVMLHDFQGLHLCLYKLDCLLMEKCQDLWQHFRDLNVTSIMYASQWFITLFSSKFPLHASFHILDLFLCEGMDAIFKVALSLLKLSRKDLLGLEFDGVLKYFRVTLPKRYQSEAMLRSLMENTAQMKLNSSRMQKYEQDWWEMKRAEAAQMEDPIASLERDFCQTKATCRRLDQENDLLASKLVTSKTSMQAEIELWSEKYETVSLELFTTRSELTDTREERDALRKELEQVKTLLRCEISAKDTQMTQKDTIIREYKEITRNLSLRLERQESQCRDLHTRMARCSADCGPWLEEYLKERNEGNVVTGSLGGTGNHTVAEEEMLTARVQELEMLLASTKLELTQCECTLQQTLHENKQLLAHIQQLTEATVRPSGVSSGNWLNKRLQSLREMTSPSSASAATSAGGLSAASIMSS